MNELKYNRLKETMAKLMSKNISGIHNRMIDKIERQMRYMEKFILGNKS